MLSSPPRRHSPTGYHYWLAVLSPGARINPTMAIASPSLRVCLLTSPRHKPGHVVSCSHETSSRLSPLTLVAGPACRPAWAMRPYAPMRQLLLTQLTTPSSLPSEPTFMALHLQPRRNSHAPATETQQPAHLLPQVSFLAQQGHLDSPQRTCHAWSLLHATNCSSHLRLASYRPADLLACTQSLQSKTSGQTLLTYAKLSAIPL